MNYEAHTFFIIVVIIFTISIYFISNKFYSKFHQYFDTYSYRLNDSKKDLLKWALDFLSNLNSIEKQISDKDYSIQNLERIYKILTDINKSFGFNKLDETSKTIEIVLKNISTYNDVKIDKIIQSFKSIKLEFDDVAKIERNFSLLIKELKSHKKDYKTLENEISKYSSSCNSEISSILSKHKNCQELISYFLTVYDENSSKYKKFEKHCTKTQKTYEKFNSTYEEANQNLKNSTKTQKALIGVFTKIPHFFVFSISFVFILITIFILSQKGINNERFLYSDVLNALKQDIISEIESQAPSHPLNKNEIIKEVNILINRKFESIEKLYKKANNKNIDTKRILVQMERSRKEFLKKYKTCE